MKQAFNKHRAWISAGGPSRFAWQSEAIHGRDARHANDLTRRHKQLYHSVLSSRQQVLERLRHHLLTQKLVATGRRDSPLADCRPIPYSAWSALHFRNLKQSELTEATTAKTRIFEVRVFPTLEAPNAPDILDGLTFAETWRSYVVGCPQLAVLRALASDAGARLAEFGFLMTPYSPVWPVTYGQGSAWNSPLYDLYRHEKPTRLAMAADDLLGKRFARLVGLLADRTLTASGMSVGAGVVIEVPRSMWARSSYVSLRNGDLHERRTDAEDPSQMLSEPKILGLVLAKSAPKFHVNSIEDDGLRFGTELDVYSHSGSPRPVVKSIAAAKAECRDWLVDMMRASPRKRVFSIEQLWQQAREKWPKRLSRRSLVSARTEAIELTGAIAWGRAGAPKKPKQSNHSAKKS